MDTYTRQTTEILARDGGHIYTESNFNHFIVEPYNALSAFLFFLIGLYWFIRLRGQYERHSFLTWATAFLTVGAIGGTIYHALRIHIFFMYMDWLPILIICLMTSAYFLDKIIGIWYYALGLVFMAILAQVVLFYYVQSIHVVSINYALMGALVLLPSILLLIKHRFRQGQWVVYALAVFCIALFFRISDHWKLLPMGTHFLWHLFGALAGHFMFLFIYKLNTNELKQ